MTTNFYPSNLQWFGLAKETTYGTPVAAPTSWVPITSPKYTPMIPPLVDQAMRGSMGMDYQQVAGQRYDTMTYTTYFYMDSIYQHMLATYGLPDVITGSGDPYTHKTALYNGSGTNGAQPVSYTGFWIDAAGKCFQIPGMQIVTNKIDVNISGLATMDITWNGMPAAEITIPTNTPTTAVPMPSWNCTITLAGSVSTAFSEVSWTYTRDTKPLMTINASQNPVAIYAGALSVAGSLNAVYQGTTDVALVDYLANTQPVLLIKIAPVGDATHSITFQHSVVAFDQVEPQGSGDWMEIASTVKALMNTTDQISSSGATPGQVVFLTPSATFS